MYHQPHGSRGHHPSSTPWVIRFRQPLGVAKTPQTPSTTRVIRFRQLHGVLKVLPNAVNTEGYTSSSYWIGPDITVNLVTCSR